MDRKILALHTVRVYRNQGDKDAGIPVRTIWNVPQWPFAGTVYYQIDGIMFPGFIDEHAPAVDACIIWTNRLKT